jgi:hypothetical protein
MKMEQVYYVYNVVGLHKPASPKNVKYTDEKENQIFLTYKEIQTGAVA